MIREYEQTGVAMTCRSLDEYVRMFDLKAEELRGKPILDVAAGASSFAAEARMLGALASAADPRYAMAPDELVVEAKAEIESSTAKLQRLQEQFDWSYYGTLDQHRAGRLAALERFRQDFADEGAGAYTAASLPHLPFEDEQFALVLCSHFLFLYGEQFDADFHREAVKELLRVCRKGGTVRIYPLLTLRFRKPPGLDELLEDIRGMGVEAELLPSSLPFIPSSVHYLRLTKR